MTSIPAGFSIDTPINRRVGAAPALGIGAGLVVLLLSSPANPQVSP